MVRCSTSAAAPAPGASAAGASHAGRTARTAGSRPAATHAGRCSTKGAPVGRAPGIRDLSIANAVPSTSPVRVHIARTGTTVGHVSSAGTAIGGARLLPICRPASVATRRLLSGLVLACICLPIRHGVASSSSAVLARSRPVRIWRAPTVLRIVLPVAIAAGGLS